MNQKTPLVLLLALALCSAAARAQPNGPCRPLEVTSQYSFDQPVKALAVAKNGSNIYAGGAFQGFNGVFMNYVAVAEPFLGFFLWNTLGSYGDHYFGPDGPVAAILSSPESGDLYLAGDFRHQGTRALNHVALIRGFGGDPPTNLGTGLANSHGPVKANALAEWDDGSGRSLFVAGSFDQAGGVEVDGLARWNGQWAALPDPDPSMPANYTSLEVWDQGMGEVLVVGSADGPIIAWDGSRWRRLGLSGANRRTVALTVWNGDLYAGGSFEMQSESQAFVARWNGTTWVDIASGTGLAGASVEALFGSSISNVEGLYAGGTFTSLGPHGTAYLARWDGVTWNPVLDSDSGLGVDGPVYALEQRSVLGSEAEIVAGGGFLQAGGGLASRVARWTGTNWISIYAKHFDLLAEFRDFVEFDAGSGPEIYASGRFGALAGRRIDSIGRWNGREWEPLQEPSGFPTGPAATALAVWDNGTGPSLYAGARFSDGLKVVRWTGSSWEPLDDFAGVPSAGGGTVERLRVWDDGSGPTLFAVGTMWIDDYGWAILTKWDGTSWIPLSPGAIDGLPKGDAEIWDDGDGAALYFARGGLVGRWDGQAVAYLPAFSSRDKFSHLEVLETPSGGYIVAAGDEGRSVAAWDGSEWTSLHPGLGSDCVTRSLETWRDDVGERLYLGGSQLVDSDPSSTLAVWDGARWNDVSFSTPPAAGASVDALYGGETGSSPLLFVGGRAETGALTLTGRVCGSPCEFDPNQLLCLNQLDRFVVSVTWRDFDGNEGNGRVVPFETGDSGLFYFFDADNWEMLVKVLDACGYNDHFWVFSAATTNVEYTLTVTDTFTGKKKRYFNPLGTAAPAVTDTAAFATCDASGTSSASSASSASSFPTSLTDEGIAKSRRVTQVDEKMDCVPSDTTMCLDGGRFALEVDWRDFDGDAGPGQVVQGAPSDDSGLFQFFGENNWEVLVKVLDACGFNDRYWVFSAATTNVEYTLSVTDTETGESVSYFNPLGNAASAVTDTDAFATCR